MIASLFEINVRCDPGESPSDSSDLPVPLRRLQNASGQRHDTKLEVVQGSASLHQRVCLTDTGQMC